MKDAGLASFLLALDSFLSIEKPDKVVWKIFWQASKKQVFLLIVSNKASLKLCKYNNTFYLHRLHYGSPLGLHLLS